MEMKINEESHVTLTPEVTKAEFNKHEMIREMAYEMVADSSN